MDSSRRLGSHPGARGAYGARRGAFDLRRVGQQRVAGAPGCKQNQIILDPRAGLQARKLGLVNPLDDGQRIMHFLRDGRYRVLVDRVFTTIG